MVKRYLSHGVGVNSTALMLLLRDDGEDFESVFVNHGTDYPETYEYLEYLRKRGYEITEVVPSVEGCGSLYEYCEKWRIIPAMFWRWCTWKFKVKPYLDYVERPCVTYIGFADGEQKRVDRRKNKTRAQDGIVEKYPLIERGLSRDDCADIIRGHGLRVPPRSMCWLCPFQSKKQIVEMSQKHPEFFERIRRLESYRGRTLMKKPIGEIVGGGTEK